MRAAVRRGPFQARRWVNLLAILWLVAGLVLPIVPVVPAAAQSAPPPLPTPTQVALSGTFQTALGCPADNDPTCPATQLAPQGDGSFAAVLPVPPGDYTFRVVAKSDQTRSLGEGGDPNGADLQLSVPNDAAGAYFSYDSLSGQIRALPVNRLVELTTDQGQRVPMAPVRQGGYRAFFDAPAGNYGFQILVNGQPIANDTISLDQPRRVVVTTDNRGNVANKDTVRDTTLVVTRTGPDGAPQPGSCFAIFDKSGDLQAQACDA
ncbi:MAG TPA: hypothetical protein VFU81_02860, partial [Thermomicrobiales bacterium]|nr:hypothetical protein [Thermomicrobiales bacterium]